MDILENFRNDHEVKPIWDQLTRIVGLDKRSLAVLRFLIGLVVLGDLINRGFDLLAHYTDNGVCTIEDILNVNENHLKFPILLHLINRVWWFQIILFVLHGCAAFSLSLGYYTTISGILTWLLTISLQSSMPWVGHAGDVYLRIILWWGIFLPWGEVWSLDQVLCSSRFVHTFMKYHNKKETSKHSGAGTSDDDSCSEYSYFSILSVGLYVHLVVVYYFSYLLKSGREWTEEGTAVYYALNLPYFTTCFGQMLASLPLGVHKFATYATLMVEKFGPLLFISPWHTFTCRMLGVILFWSMHGVFALSLRIGLFTYVTLAFFVVFISPPVWEWLDHSDTSMTIKRFFVSSVSKFKFRNLLMPPLKQQVYFLLKVSTHICIAVLIWLIIGWNCNQSETCHCDVCEKVLWLSHFLRLDQSWDMFAPRPPKGSFWFVIHGVTENNTSLELFRNGGIHSWIADAGEVTFRAPPSFTTAYKNHRWYKYFENGLFEHSVLRKSFVQYVCREYNARHYSAGDRLTTVRVWEVEDILYLNRTRSSEKSTLIWKDDKTKNEYFNWHSDSTIFVKIT